MRVVGIRELKARLSEYLRDVRRGEVFLVTDRNQVVAELRPPGTHAVPPADDVAATLQRLIETGEVQAASRSAEEWQWKPAGAGLEAGTAVRLLDGLRAERDGG
jgi:antitoxin (DNA-binding transcriptional repressor) of toxin-antitoxin stability system